MSRGEFALVVWLSIQLLFISCFSMILVRLFRIWRKAKEIDRVLNQRTFLLLFIADSIAMFSEEWGTDPAVLREKLLPRVREYRSKVEQLKPSNVKAA